MKIPACRQTITCDLCSKVVTKPNYHKHRRYCENIPTKKETIDYKNWFDGNSFTCPICQFNTKNRRSIVSHYWISHIYNITTHKRNKENNKKHGWNKGLTKYTDERVAKTGVTLSLVMKGKPGRHQTEAEKLATSERMSLHNPGGKCKWYTVANQKVQGNYERLFAECLEIENIQWEKIKTNNRIFTYTENGKIKSYAPDFYLPSFDCYIEIKGFWWGKDENKMRIIREQHQDKKLIVIFGIDKLTKICENIRENLPLEPVWSW